MDFVKFKLATFGKSGQQQRFNYCNPLGDLTKPELTGLLPSAHDYQLGTPNLNRNENISLICSNTFNRNSLVLNLKWRPNKLKDITTLLCDFKLVINNIIYSYDSTETYKPQKSSVQLNRYTQYGSSQSSLKLIISRPYRRMRLFFRGYMKRSDLNSEVFVSLNLIVTTTSATFDFLDQYNPKCFRQAYLQNKHTSSRGYRGALNDLILHDCHEHSVRVAGDCSIGLDTSEIVYLWGFYSREFIIGERKSKNLNTTHLLGHISNGQIFHVGYNQIDGEKLPFGYTCYAITPNLVPIDRPFILNCELDSETDQFRVVVFGQNILFETVCRRRQTGLKGFFEAEMNKKAGWVYLSFKNSSGRDLEEETIRKSELKYLQLAEEGKIVQIQPFDGDEKPLITTIDDVYSCCNNLVGSKAASLAQLKKFQENCTYKVPHAFVLTKFAYDALLEHNKSIGEAVLKLEEMVGEAKTDGLREECERLRKLVEESSLPDELVQQVAGKLEQHYGKDEFAQMKFAVRSSSWGEDEEDMSAAGQLTTILAVQGSIEAISEAVLKCFGSKFSYENIQYKRQRGLPLGLPMAVVIQEMVDCDKAGVMFTCDPRTGDNRCTFITGNYGLGESVVGGQAEPDTIKIRRKLINSDGVEFEIEDLKVGSKSVVVDEETLKGSKSSREYDRTICCLTESESLALAEVGHQLTQYYQFAVDVEWGFKGDQLYLLQSRPITGLDTFTDFELQHELDTSSRSEYNLLTRANIQEVNPKARTPFTLTFYGFIEPILMRRLFARYTTQMRPICTYCAIESLYDSYLLFLSLKCSSFFVFPKENQQLSEEELLLSQAMQVAYFGHPIEDQSDIVQASRGILALDNPFLGSKFNLRTLPMQKAPVARVMKQKPVMSWLRQQVTSLKFASDYNQNKMVGLYNQLKQVVKYHDECWQNLILIIMFSGGVNMELTSLLSKYIKDAKLLYSASARFIATAPDVISAEIPVRLERLAKLIRSSEFHEEFANKWSYEECLEFLKEGGEKDLVREYGEFLKLFGHRAYNEFELADLSWSQEQKLIVEMLKKSCCVEGRPEVAEGARKKQSIEEAIAGVESECSIEISLSDRLKLRRSLVPRVQLMVAARERTKDILIEYTDIARLAARMLAIELRRNLRIPDEQLFFYLLYEDLEPLIRQPQARIVLQASRRRNLFNRHFSSPWKFDEIVKGYAPQPKHLQEEVQVRGQEAKLFGTPASGGRVQGRVCLVSDYSELNKVQFGDILLTHSTDIAYSPVFPLIKGIITEVGGLISHGANIAREYNLASVIGVEEATRIIKHGEEVILDANKGVVIRLSLANTS